MKNFFSRVLDFIFPTSCIICRTGNTSICATCFAKIEVDKKDHLNTLSVYRYRDKVINNLLWKLKYHHSGDIAEIFGKKFAVEIQTWLDIDQEKENFKIYLIPMPLNLHDKRMYNHAELLANEISTHLPNSKVLSNLLLKNSKKKQAHTKNKHERIKNVEKTFFINPKNNLNEIIASNIFIIIDDVITTGASITNAKYTLAEFFNISPENILAATVAH